MNRHVEDKVRTNDQLALEIIRILKESYQEIADSQGPYNVIALFFHDLVVHFTGVVIHREALGKYPGQVVMPWVNQEYARQPFPMKLNIGVKPNWAVKNIVRQIPIMSFGYGNGVSFEKDKYRIKSILIQTLGEWQRPAKAYLRNRREQIEILRIVVEKISNFLNVRKRSVVWRNWETYSEIHTTEHQELIRRKSLIVGSRNDLQNRKIAFNYLQQDKEVVGFTHGEVANSIYDEPVYGYSDLSFCSTLVDYGSFRGNGVYNDPLVVPPKIVTRSSSAFQEIYKPSSRILPRNLLKTRNLYLSMMYQGNYLYGPFHVYEDGFYLRWQKALISALPDITIKLHPKSRTTYPLPCRIERGRLETCIENYDVIILDYFATAGIMAAATNKPIIYFDIGLRNLNHSFLKSIRDRTTVKRIDFGNELTSQVREALSNHQDNHEGWNNEQMSQYSVSKRESFSWLNVMNMEA